MLQWWKYTPLECLEVTPNMCAHLAIYYPKSFGNPDSSCPLSHSHLLSTLSPLFSLCLFSHHICPTRFTLYKTTMASFCQIYFSRCFVTSFLLNVTQICLPLRLGWTVYNFSSPATQNGSLAKQQPPSVRSASESHIYRKHASSYSAITFSGVCFSSEAKGIWWGNKYTKACSIGVSLTKSTAKEN